MLMCEFVTTNDDLVARGRLVTPARPPARPQHRTWAVMHLHTACSRSADCMATQIDCKIAVAVTGDGMTC